MDKIRHLQREIIYDSDSIIRSTNQSMGIQMEDLTQQGYEYYHSHVDYQLMLLTKGSVDIVIDERIKKYTKGDILLLGCNLPHYLIAGTVAEGYLIQFPPDLFPPSMPNMSDYVHIYALLNNADGGLLYDASKTSKQKNLFSKIHQAKGIGRICYLLQLLDGLGKQLNDSETICYLSQKEENKNTQVIISKCKKYIRSNYTSEIRLEQIANIANLNKTALCRTFHRETGETLFQYIIRLRIESSFKLLRNTNMGIAEIAYQCGFNSLPHFNKKFKAITTLSPSEYRVSMRG